MDLTHFVKGDPVRRTRTSATPVEETNYTISWSDLTGAGFGNGDDVIVLVWAALNQVSANNYVRFQVGFGTTYSGRSDESDSYASIEPRTNVEDEANSYFWMDRRTLVTNENIYFSLWSPANAAYCNEFKCVVLKLDDLDTDDFLYQETTPSGDAPATPTDGASVTTAASGDWLFLGMTRWLCDSTTAAAWTRINVDGSTYCETGIEGEDTENEWPETAMAYVDSLASSKVAKIQYYVQTSSTHDCVGTKIFGLRLDAFETYWGTKTTSTVTYSAVDTYYDAAANASLSVASTGNFIAIGYFVNDVTDYGKRPYGRITVDSTEWPSSNYNRNAWVQNAAATPTEDWLSLVVGYGSVSSGSRDVAFEVAEDVDVDPTYDCIEQNVALFSVAMAGAGPQTVTPAGIASAEAFGSVTVVPGAVAITPSGIASAEVFGAATVTAIATVQPSGIASAEAFGSATVVPGIVTITLLVGILSQEAFGSPTVIILGALSIQPSGIPTAEGFGAPVVTGGEPQLASAWWLYGFKAHERPYG
jgi:hypothetical protein